MYSSCSTHTGGSAGETDGDDEDDGKGDVKKPAKTAPTGNGVKTDAKPDENGAALQKKLVENGVKTEEMALALLRKKGMHLVEKCCTYPTLETYYSSKVVVNRFNDHREDFVLRNKRRGPEPTVLAVDKRFLTA